MVFQRRTAAQVVTSYGIDLYCVMIKQSLQRKKSMISDLLAIQGYLLWLKQRCLSIFEFFGGQCLY